MATCLTLAVGLAACSGGSSPRPAGTTGQETPSPTGPASQSSADASPSPGGAAADCAAPAVDLFQLAYVVPGMDDVEVTCDIVYKQIAGADATLDLYLPTHAADAALPAVVFVHGNGDIAELKPIEEHWYRRCLDHLRLDR